jgi:hypothetical protein
MKKNIFLLSIVQFVLLTSCNKEVSSPSIVGKWNWVETTAPIATLTSYGPINKGSNVTLEFFSNSTYTITENGNVIDKGNYTTGHNKNASNLEYDYYKLNNSSLPVYYLIWNCKPIDFNSVSELPITIDINNVMEVDFSKLGITGYGKIRYKKN